MRVVESGLELGSGKRAVELGKQENREMGKKREGGEHESRITIKIAITIRKKQKEGRNTKRKDSNKR